MTQPCRIRLDLCGNLARVGNVESDTLFRCRVAHHGNDIGNHLAGRDLQSFDINLSRFNLGEVENVGQHANHVQTVSLERV